jgi:2-polyprenyl-6-methoxyphenol hydroxylase-like FAD-dependent oxidoreductase
VAAADLTDEVPVVIAGAGPAGLVAAITLARNGIGSLLVERNPGLSPLPRATAAATLDTPFPLTVHTLDPATADTLAITPDGATLIRPDAQPIVYWPTAPADPPATLAAVTTGWSNRQAAPVG